MTNNLYNKQYRNVIKLNNSKNAYQKVHSDN